MREWTHGYSHFSLQTFNREIGRNNPGSLGETGLFFNSTRFVTGRCPKPPNFFQLTAPRVTGFHLTVLVIDFVAKSNPCVLPLPPRVLCGSHRRPQPLVALRGPSITAPAPSLSPHCTHRSFGASVARTVFTARSK